MINYPALIDLDDDGVSYNAREALSVYLESPDSRSRDIPKASKPEGANVFHIIPDITIAFAIQVKKIREKKG